MRTRLGQYLVLTGTISEERLTEALAEQEETGQALGQILHAHGWITEGQLAQTLAAQLELDFVDAPVVAPEPAAIQTLPAATAAKLGALPLAWQADVLRVAVADPLDISVLEELEDQVGAMIEPVVAEATALASAIEHQYAVDLQRRQALDTARQALREHAAALPADALAPTFVACAAGAPGIGLTHVVVNVGCAAAAQGLSVAVVDASVGSRNGLTPAGLTSQTVCGDLLHADLDSAVPGWGETAHGFHVIGGATGAPLRHGTPADRIRGAANLVRLGAAHRLILCDLGSPPLDGAAEWLLAADVSVVLTTAQDIVGTFELLRAAAADRRRRYPLDREPRPWNVGIVVTQVDAPAAGRAVFDHLTGAVQRHVNAEEVAAAGHIRLGLLGTVPFDRDGAAAAEAGLSPTVADDPASALAQGTVGVTKAVLERARRVPPAPWPMAELVALAGTTPDPRR